MTLKTQKKTVIQWLDEVRYVDDNNYKPSAFALMFVNFIKLVNDGMGEENVTTSYLSSVQPLSWSRA